jgi:predicted RND superfamily exporter protein
MVSYVSNVISLTSIDDIVGTEGGLEIQPLIEEFDSTENRVSLLKHRIEINPFIKKNLISDDGKTLCIILEVTLGKGRYTNKITTQITEEIRDLLNIEHTKTGRNFYLAGDKITDNDVMVMMDNDMQKFWFFRL